MLHSILRAWALGATHGQQFPYQQLSNISFFRYCFSAGSMNSDVCRFWSQIPPVAADLLNSSELSTNGWIPFSEASRLREFDDLCAEGTEIFTVHIMGATGVALVDFWSGNVKDEGRLGGALWGVWGGFVMPCWECRTCQHWMQRCVLISGRYVVCMLRLTDREDLERNTCSAHLRFKSQQGRSAECIP